MSRWSTAMMIVVAMALAAAGSLRLQAVPPDVRGSRPATRSRPLHTRIQSQGPAPASVSAHRLFLNRYCIACHNQRLKTAGLMLDAPDLGRISQGAEVWEKVVLKLCSRAMPPESSPRPDDSMYDVFVNWLETELDRAAASAPNPGRATVHRLNRVEYGNAVRDLLGLEVDAEALLPSDDEDQGFRCRGKRTPN